MPLPGSHPVHARWSEHHRHVASATHTATCVIERATGAGIVQPDGTWTPPPMVMVYAGHCRITARPAGERVVVVGEQQVTVRRYAVAIAWDAPEIASGDLVEITSAHDPRLPGKKFRITDVQHGGQQWERVLMAEERVAGQEG